MESVKIFCVNTSTRYEVEIGSTLLDVSKRIFGELENLAPVAVLVNNSLKDLGFRVFTDTTVEFVNITTQDGYSVVTRSLIFLLYTAFRELYPDGTIVTEYYISGGVYCTLKAGGYSGTAEQLQGVKEHMMLLVKADWPILRDSLKSDEALELFRRNCMTDKAFLLATRGRLHTSVYRLNGTLDYFFGVLVPSTGHLKVFDLVAYGDGVLLRLPDPRNVEKVANVTCLPKLKRVQDENRAWGSLQGILNVGDLNRWIADGHGGDIVKICEAYHEKQISRIADEVAAGKDRLKMIMIAGPSSSGKTTFSKRLGVQLMVNGIVPITISMDDYFVERANTPRDENGDYDFETIDAVDIPFFVSQMKQLLAGEEVEIPKFSFIDGSRHFDGTKLRMKKNSVIVVEGIHGLNPKLTSLLDRKSIYKIFVSALTAISIDEHNLINPTDNRLIRRMIRDYKFRGRSARETLETWHMVLEGERKYIIPYQEEADAMFNTALLYELGVLRTQAEPLLREVPENCKEHSKALKLLKFLSYVKVIYPDEVPNVSLIREFLGGSSFSY